MRFGSFLKYAYIGIYAYAGIGKVDVNQWNTSLIPCAESIIYLIFRKVSVNLLNLRYNAFQIKDYMLLDTAINITTLP